MLNLKFKTMKNRLLNIFYFVLALVLLIGCNNEDIEYCNERAKKALNRGGLDEWTSEDTLTLEMGGIWSEYRPYTCICKYEKINDEWEIKKVSVNYN